MEKAHLNIPESRLANVASRAVGVTQNERFWFIAVVLNNTELSSRDKIEEAGFDAYVPTKQELVVWRNGRKKKKEKILIPSVVFVRCTEEDRRRIVSFSFVKYFMVDPAGKTGSMIKNPVARVPDVQMRNLQFMLKQNCSDVVFEPMSIKIGDTVKVTRGCLTGMVGEICICSGSRKVGILLNGLGYACVNLDSSDLEILDVKQ